MFYFQIITKMSKTNKNSSGSDTHTTKGKKLPKEKTQPKIKHPPNLPTSRKETLIVSPKSILTEPTPIVSPLLHEASVSTAKSILSSLPINYIPKEVLPTKDSDLNQDIAPSLPTTSKNLLWPKKTTCKTKTKRLTASKKRTFPPLRRVRKEKIRDKIPLIIESSPSCDSPDSDNNHDMDTSNEEIPIKESIKKLNETVSQLTEIVQSLVSNTSTGNTIRQDIASGPNIPHSSGSMPQFSSVSPLLQEPGDFLFSAIPETRTNGANFSSGLAAGEHLPDRLKQKIWSDCYIDFYNLLYPDNEGSYNLSLNTAHQQGLKLTPKKSRPLTEREWNRAFDDFLAVYTRKFPQLISEVITYGKFIKELMAQGHNWALYDTRFRKDREFNKCPWTTIRVDLHIQALHSPSIPRLSPHQFNQTQPFRKPVRGNIAIGYCFKYNTSGVYCTEKNCPYKHECSRCSQKHPMFLPCVDSYGKDRKSQTPPFNKTSANSQQTSNPDPSRPLINPTRRI